MPLLHLVYDLQQFHSKPDVTTVVCFRTLNLHDLSCKTLSFCTSASLPDAWTRSTVGKRSDVPTPLHR